MDDEETVGGFWASIREVNAGYLLLTLGFIAVVLAVYFFRYRPLKLSDILPSFERFQALATTGAFVLIALTAVAALWQLFTLDLDEDNGSWFRALLSSFKELPFAYVVFAVSLIVFAAGFYLLRNRAGSIAYWLSIDSLRNYALATAVVLITIVCIFSVVQYLWSSWTNNAYSAIAPFVIAGSDDKQRDDKQRGLALATALRAKLAEIQADTNALDELLQKEVDESETGILRQDVSETASLNVYRKLDLDLKFQGVDFGGILNWMVNWIAMRRALQITVAEQGESALVSGSLSPDGSAPVHTTVKSDNERIVAAVAYSQLREHLISQQEEFVGLDWEDIELLHRSVMAVTRLRARSQVTMQDFEIHHQAIAKLIAKAPKLESLLTLGAEVAMKAGKIDAALAYLDRTNEFLNEKRDELDRAKSELEGEKNGDHETELKRARQEFVNKYIGHVVQRQRIISSCALPFVERLHANPPEEVFVDALAPHKELLRIGAIEQKRNTRVAILGGVPQRERIGYPFELVGHWMPGKYGLDNFADTIGLIVSTLAPSAKLIFVPLGPGSRSRGLGLLASEAEIEQAVNSVIEVKADVVLIPFVARNNRRRVATVKRFSGDAVIVTPALSKNAQAMVLDLASPDVSSIPALFVASSDVDGRYKGATLSLSGELELTSYPGAVWAPGMRIPRLTADGMWQTTYGSPYAVATAAAVVANVAAASADRKTAGELVALLKASQRSLSDRHSGISILDQAGALKIADLPQPAHQAQSICGKDQAGVTGQAGQPSHGKEPAAVEKSMR